MKILITGGAGFLGSNLAIELQKRKEADIVVLDNFYSSNKENLKEFKGEIIEGSVTDKDLVFSLGNFSYIFHFASITDTTIEDENLINEVNVEGFRNILELAKKTGAKVIYASSAAVYGNGKVPMNEKQKLEPLNFYSASKVTMEKIANEFYEKESLVSIGLRYFNVYGQREGHKGKSASMVWQLFHQMKRGNRPRIYKYGHHMRDFIYIKDAIEATIKSMELNEKIIINVGTGVATSFNNIVDILNAILDTNYKPEYIDNPYIKFYQVYTKADTELLNEKLKFKCKFDIIKGIKDYLTPK